MLLEHFKHFMMLEVKYLSGVCVCLFEKPIFCCGHQTKKDVFNLNPQLLWISKHAIKISMSRYYLRDQWQLLFTWCQSRPTVKRSIVVQFCRPRHIYLAQTSLFSSQLHLQQGPILFGCHAFPFEMQLGLEVSHELHLQIFLHAKTTDSPFWSHEGHVPVLLFLLTIGQL